MIFWGKTKKISKSTKVMYQSTDIYIENFSSGKHRLLTICVRTYRKSKLLIIISMAWKPLQIQGGKHYDSTA